MIYRILTHERNARYWGEPLLKKIAFLISILFLSLFLLANSKEEQQEDIIANIYESELSIYDPTLKTLIMISLKGRAERYINVDGAVDHDEKSRAFAESLKFAKDMLSTLEEQELRFLVELANRGFILAFEDDTELTKDQLKAFLTNAIRMPEEEQRNLLSCCNQIQTSEGLRLEPLMKLNNMDSPTRLKFLGSLRALNIVFQKMEIPNTYEARRTLFEYPDLLPELYNGLFDETGEIKEPVFCAVRYLSKELKIKPKTMIDFKELLDASIAFNSDLKLITPLVDLFKKYEQGTKASSFIRNIADFVIYAENPQIFVDLATDPELAKVYEKFIKLYGINGDACDLLPSDSIDELKTFTENDFYLWTKTICETYGCEISDKSEVRFFYRMHSDEDLRLFLISQESKNFFEEAKQSEQRYSCIFLNELHEDVQSRDLLFYVGFLKKNYQIDLSERLSHHEKLLADMSMFEQDPSPIEYVQGLQMSGLLETIKDQETIRKFHEFSDKYNIRIRKYGFLDFLFLIKSPEYYECIISDDFISFYNKFINDFPDFAYLVGAIPYILNAYETGNFFDIVGKLQTNLDPDISVKDIEDIDTVILFSKTPKLLDQILKLDFKYKWRAFKEKNDSANLENILAVYQISLNNVSLDNLYEDVFETFLIQVLQKTKFSFKERIQMYRYYYNPNTRQSLLSQDYRNLLATIKIDMLDFDTIKSLLFLVTHPHVIKPYQDFKYDTIINDVLPSLELIELDEKILIYRDILLTTLPYIYSVADGFALRELTSIYPTPTKFQEACEALRANLIKAGVKVEDLIYAEKYYINDLFHALADEFEFSYARDNLEKVLASSFENDVHRTDSNFFGYSSYNELEKWNLFELNKAVRIKTILDDDKKLRQFIGQKIQEDVEEEITTELGGLVTSSGRFQYIAPEIFISNGTYILDQSLFNQAYTSLGTMHQHATKYNSRAFASPSGSIFKSGGDITSSANIKVDGIVITSLQEGLFAVHMYNDRKDVLFLGVWNTGESSFFERFLN